jgi:hypothetical protein
LLLTTSLDVVTGFHFAIVQRLLMLSLNRVASFAHVLMYT